MPALKTNGLKKRAAMVLALSGAVVAGLGRVEAQAVGAGKLAAAAPVTYDNRYEIFGGAEYMNFQAGQNVPKLMNLGGAEVSGTYWINSKWGAVADYRGGAGTTPVVPNATFNGRALVVLNTGMLGAQYRVAQNQRFAFDLHALAGVSHGWFDETLPSNQSQLYTNRTKPIGAIGGSLDLNRTKNLAIRLSPDLILEHYGTETREFVAVSGGVIYRFGHR